MSHKKWGILAVLTLMACNGPATVEWTEGEPQPNGRAEYTLVLKNMPGGSRLWFQELYDNLEVIEPADVRFTHYQGTSVYIDIPENAPKTLTVRYLERNLPRWSWAPEGFVLQQKGKEDRPIEPTYHFLERKWEEPSSKWFEAAYEPGPADIIPAVKQAGSSGEPRQITDILVTRVEEEHPAGWYHISVRDAQAQLFAADDEGEHNARATMQKLGGMLPQLEIEDWPDFGYRGFMMDVVRDFRTKDEMLKLIDLAASYKVNRLHFHVGDDESWCLEIKKLPELTAFSGHHALPDWDLQETRALKPTANGKIGNTTFFTEDEYKEILRHAWDKGIAVIPEFDIPGHSRSSIKAMQAYERRTGDSTYRLQDPADTSRYWSAQDFTDNVIDPELPGVYRFYAVVFDEVMRMHREAEVPLLAIHIGGDEVPGGVWSGRDAHALKDLFTNKILDLAEERGLKLAGWQELALGLQPATGERLKKSLYFLNAWSRHEQIELTYQLANKGFPVLLSNVHNTYVDLAYGADPADIGLHWGGFVDERKTFALQPWKIYESYRIEGVDTPVDLSHAAEGKTALERPENVIGVQVNLWSEGLRCFDDATYQLLPKALGAWERAWNASPDWSDDAAFARAFDRFYSIIRYKEMPWWDQAGYKYKKR